MKVNKLIAKIAIDLVSQEINNEREGTLRFCMVGLDAPLVVSIAKLALASPEVNAAIMVRIDPKFDPKSKLPPEIISDESITRWRHCPPEDGKRGVLFVASHEDLRRNDKSVEKITRIETDRLRDEYKLWVEHAGLSSKYLVDADREHLNACLRAANNASTVRSIRMFADFVLSITNGIVGDSLSLQRAVDNALPTLHLFKNAGHFDRIPRKTRSTQGEWNKVFRRLHAQMPHWLVRENSQGELITEKLKENFVKIKTRRLEEHKPPLSEEQIRVIEAFLDADLTPDKWSPEQIDLVNLDWHDISDLFNGIERAKPRGIGELTLELFVEEFPDQLDDDEKGLLRGDFPRNPSDGLREFFYLRREQLARKKGTYIKWERYIYQNPQPFDNFWIGLIDTVHRLRERTRDENLTSKRLVVRIRDSQQKSFWRSKNFFVVQYFSFRYRGLSRLFGEDIHFDFGRLEHFYFPEPEGENLDLVKATSTSKEARQLKFEVELDPDGVKEGLIFIWEMPPNALARALPRDLRHIANVNGETALLPTANIARQSVSAKGQIQRIALDDVNTIRDVDKANNGTLVAPNIEDQDQGSKFLHILDELLEGPALSEAQHQEISTAFADFVEKYTRAIRDWINEEGLGISSPALAVQADSYGRLLETLSNNANNDVARHRIWGELLRIGIANIGGGAPASIITPWHPLRLAEIHVKAKQAAELIKTLQNASEDHIFRADILLSQKRQELQSDYYPEVCVGYEDDQPVLLAATETLLDYTLAEQPQRHADQDGDGTLDIDPKVAAQAFGEVGEQYLKLLPHERTNFSVVLYNAESKALPSAIASELSSKVEQESELQCDLLLTHSNPIRMREIYEQQNIAVSEKAGSIMASETARNFLSRLRVGFLDSENITSTDAARATDLVLLQDVIARNAQVRWKKTPSDQHPDLLNHIPSRWTRRRPIGSADQSFSVYLTAPVQPKPGQAFLNAIQIYLNGDNAQSGNVIPTREITFRDSNVSRIFQQAHDIGEWVVNFDDLVDRKLLRNNGINVIHHIHNRNMNRNIVVSTTSTPRMLHSLISQRLDHIDRAILRDNQDVADKLIERANGLSGQIVMRAARYGHFANELLGVVLSMQRLKAGMDNPSLPIGWYFLDDFASWFGQSEEQIADIMAIAPRVVNGIPTIKIAIAEAKFVTSKDYRSNARKSAKQLESTISRISRALDPKHERIDRETWLHRLGDFIIEGMEPLDGIQGNNWNLHQWSDEIRQDKIPIEIAGFSHIFVHDDEAPVDSVNTISMDYCVQEILDMPHVADELRRFAAARPIDSEYATQAAQGWKQALTSKQTTKSQELGASATPETSSSNEKLQQQDKTPKDIDKTENQVAPTSSLGSARAAEMLQKPISDGKEFEKRDESFAIHKPTETKRWPSIALREWVDAGKSPGEEGGAALEWLDTIVQKLQRAFRGYDMTAELIGCRLTPNAALVRFRGSDDLTMTKVGRRRQELLTSHAIDVINILGAPGEIIIMVRRPKRVTLRLRDMWHQRQLPDAAPETNSSLLLGAQESNGELLYLNVEDEFSGYQRHGPHTLIAGETGSGKGVLVQCLLLDICATNSPFATRIRVIDPKAGIDFPWVREMPHLEGDLITQQSGAIKVFEGLVAEMERRNRLLASARVTKLTHYNKKVTPEERLPRIWLFHDEFADWMLVDEYRNAVENHVTRLGIKARAAGINLVLVTQRPDKDALPMQLRANLSNRLVLKVADKRNSELVLDAAGAECLLGGGHLAAKLSGEGKIILAQVPYADEDEIAELADLIADAWRDPSGNT